MTFKKLILLLNIFLFLASIAEYNNVLTDLNIYSVLYKLLNFKSVNIAKAKIEILYLLKKNLKNLGKKTMRW